MSETVRQILASAAVAFFLGIFIYMLCETFKSPEDLWETKMTRNEYKYDPRLTNADRIRAMTDEELARRFATLNEWTQEAPANFNHEDVYQFWLDWLKQEADEGE